MYLIRTTDELAALRASPPHPDLPSLLQCYAGALAEFGDALHVRVLIVEASDTLASAGQAVDERLVDNRCLAFPVELITRHEHWFEVVWITSDDGSGIVLLVEIAAGADAELIAACETALAEAAL